MKIVVIGDIHGRDWWYNAIDNESDADLFVFLGDYVTTHEGISSDQQCAICEDILNFKAENLDKVILLRGNHDNQMLGYAWAECSGYDSKVASWLTGIKDRFLSLTQWIYIHDDMIFSHAGISTEWMRYYKINDVTEINSIEPCPTFGFTSNRFSDYCGESSIQPCTWIRPTTLARYLVPEYTQIVGHTPITHIRNLKESDPPFEIKENLWCCDTNLTEYLVINIDNETKEKNFVIKPFKTEI